MQSADQLKEKEEVLISKNFKQGQKRNEIRAPSTGSSGSQPRVMAAGQGSSSMGSTGTSTN